MTAPGVDRARLEILPDHLNDTRAGLANMIHHLPAVGGNRRAARQRHSECFTYDVHGICRSHAGADAGAAHRDVGHISEFADRDGAGRHIPGLQKDFFDIDVLTAVLATLLIAADNNDRRDVEPSRCHQLTGGGLVARCKTDHAVEQCAFDLDLDVARDQITGRKDIGSAPTNTGNEVARRRGAHFERQATGRPDRGLHIIRNAVEMAKAARQFR